ncbi:MAG: hypothetical protein CMH57_15905 [Myxococcales bacterium]|nr:hypothetical protein [Myxococcales bacterium]
MGALALHSPGRTNADPAGSEPMNGNKSRSTEVGFQAPEQARVAWEPQQRPGADLEQAVQMREASGLSGESLLQHMAQSPVQLKEGDALAPVQMEEEGAENLPQEPSPAVRVRNRISDPPYGWTSTYDAQVTDSDVRINVKVKLLPQAGVTEEDIANVDRRATAAFINKFDNQFVFSDGQHEFPVRVNVQFVETGEHLSVRIHAGNRRSNLSNWALEAPDETYAHELGHQLGLLDEYVDAGATNRADASGAGVHTDHSIMGNYHAEGRRAAAVRQRHGETIASHVGSATGHEFTVRPRR